MTIFVLQNLTIIIAAVVGSAAAIMYIKKGGKKRPATITALVAIVFAILGTVILKPEEGFTPNPEAKILVIATLIAFATATLIILGSLGIGVSNALKRNKNPEENN